MWRVYLITLMLDPIYLVNLTLCVIIFILGFLGYRKGGNKIPLYVGIAFGFANTYLGLKAGLTISTSIPVPKVTISTSILRIQGSDRKASTTRISTSSAR